MSYTTYTNNPFVINRSQGPRVRRYYPAPEPVPEVVIEELSGPLEITLSPISRVQAESLVLPDSPTVVHSWPRLHSWETS